MCKISVFEGRSHCRLVLEGKLVAPWATELRTACETARANLRGRELVIDVKNLTAINQQAENILLGLMNEGVKFRCHGVFAKHVLKQLAARMHWKR